MLKIISTWGAAVYLTGIDNASNTAYFKEVYASAWGFFRRYPRDLLALTSERILQSTVGHAYPLTS